MMTKVNATVILDKELYNRIESFASRNKLSMDNLISKVIRQYLAANDK